MILYNIKVTNFKQDKKYNLNLPYIVYMRGYNDSIFKLENIIGIIHSLDFKKDGLYVDVDFRDIGFCLLGVCIGSRSFALTPIGITEGEYFNIHSFFFTTKEKAEKLGSF